MSTPEPVTLASPQSGERQSDGQTTRTRAASQARLNEIVAGMIRAVPGDRHVTMALEALRYHNWASGFEFEGKSHGIWSLQGADLHETLNAFAVRTTRQLESGKKIDAGRARMAAIALKDTMPPDIAALTRRLKADAPALVYVITHAALGAAKIGVSDAAGSRIAQHRRAGWQLIAAFHVAVYAACEIEDDVLRWWRSDLGLPPCLKREQMPQGGWTETVAVGAIDLAATVARVCEQALLPDAWGMADGT
jgi:hypothetical protein